jgi:AAA+ ATPase superfamily predicted ATPase
MFVEPVFGKRFFGREEVLATLHKRVTALKGGYRQNLALTGPMLAGKSSILRHFLDNVKDIDIVPLYLEMTGEDFHVFCKRFTGSLLYNYLISLGQSPGKDIDELKRTCRNLIPETVSCIDKVESSLQRKRFNIAYETLLGMTSVFRTETGKSCLVILDEFHNLADFKLKRPFRTFGKFIMVQKNTMYIVSSSQKTLLKDILSRKLSLLFGNFEVVEVEGFDNHTARSYVSDKLPATGEYRYISDYMIQVTQGSPFYLEVLSGRFSELRQYSPDKTPEETLLDVFADILYSSEGILNQYFNNNVNFFLEKRSRKKFLPILVSLASGNATLKDIQKDMGRADKSLARKLRKLQDMDLVYKCGVFYKVSDKLFEYWLRYVYAVKSRSMLDDMGIKYLEFKNAVQSDLRAYLEFASRDIPELVEDLFRTFNNEMVGIRMTDRRMPGFDSVTLSAESLHLSRITCLKGDKAWICDIIRGDIADEADILRILGNRAGKGYKKVLRRIIVPLKGLDQNAFLLAKERKIWVWDIKQLNLIFRLFKQFQIVA